MINVIADQCSHQSADWFAMTAVFLKECTEILRFVMVELPDGMC